MNLQKLNERYAKMTLKQRIRAVYCDFGKVLLTSSFGTSSAILLHLFSKINAEQKVHFIDTTYHFVETLQYKETLTELLNLQVDNILPKDQKNAFTRKDRTWTKDPDLCCSTNKVEPLDELKSGFEVWVSGLMAFQNAERRMQNIFEKREGIIKFHPIIDFTEKQKEAYFIENDLPRHPLEKIGYHSIGCAQCTFKGEGRGGRWGNSYKTECGLHLYGSVHK